MLLFSDDAMHCTSIAGNMRHICYRGMDFCSRLSGKDGSGLAHSCQPSKAHRGQTTWSTTIALLGQINHLPCPSTSGGRTDGRIRNEKCKLKKINNESGKNCPKDDAKHSGCIKFFPSSTRSSLMLSMPCRHFVRPISPHA